MLKERVAKVVSGESLEKEEARETLREILGGGESDALIAGLLVGLAMKGETPEEIAGFASGMREMAIPVRRTHPVIDTCGTGGDRKGSFNVSTAAAFIAAGAGALVAKHGNKGVSSACGSADVLARLGVKIELGPEKSAECIEKVGICFLFAPAFHPATKRVMGVRTSLGIPTVFNLLGPLTNPSSPEAQVLGVNRLELLPLMGKALSELGVEKAYVLHGKDGMDEFSLSSETHVFEVNGGKSSEYVLYPEDLGLKRHSCEEIRGGDPERNAAIIHEVLAGEPGACLETSVANAAFALAAAGIASSPIEGVELARESVFSGAAAKKLERLVELTND